MGSDLQTVGPVLIGLACFFVSVAVTYWRKYGRVAKRFDFIEHLVAPLIVLAVLIVAYFAVDLQGEYSVGLTALLVMAMLGPAFAMGPPGWAIWVVLVYCLVHWGGAAMASVGLASIGLVAGEPLGYAIARCRARNRAGKDILL